MLFYALYSLSRAFQIPHTRSNHEKHVAFVTELANAMLRIRRMCAWKCRSLQAVYRFIDSHMKMTTTVQQ